MTTTRFDFIDVMKGMAILFVIFFHAERFPFSYFYWLWSCFGLQLFFFSSGYCFSNKRRGGEFLLHKIKTMLIPYLIGSILLRIFKCHVNGTCDAIGEWFVKTFILFKRIDYLWFLPALFFINLLLYFVVTICDNKETRLRFISIAFLLIPLYTSNIYDVKLPFQVDAICNCFIYAWSGYLFKLNKSALTPVVSFCRKHKRNLFCFSMFTILLSYFIKFSPCRSVNYFYNCLGFLPHTYLVQFSCICTTIAFAQFLEDKQGLLFRTLKHFGRYSIVYYMLHRELMRSLFASCPKIDNISLYTINVFMVVVVTLLISYLVVLILKKIKPLGNIFGVS